MKSKLTMEWDFSINKAMIKVLKINSEDIRDRLFESFVNELNYTSSWFKFEASDVVLPEGFMFFIRPISPAELPKEAEIIQEQLRVSSGKDVEQKYSKEEMLSFANYIKMENFKGRVGESDDFFDTWLKVKKENRTAAEILSHKI